MNDDRKFRDAKNPLIQLLSVGLPFAVIMAYFKICQATCLKYVNRLKEAGLWNQKSVSFLDGVKDVIRTYVLIKKRNLILGGVDFQKLQTAIEETLEFERIIEILKISINSVRKLTVLEFSPEIPTGYQDFITTILFDNHIIYDLNDNNAKSLFIRHLCSEKDFQVGNTISTWFYPMIDDIISENVSSLRGSVAPTFDVSVVEKVDYLFSTMSEREVEVIKKYFGIGFQKTSLDEIGAEIGLTAERVRQIKEKSLRRCRALKRRNLLLNPLPSAEPLIPVLTTVTPLESLDMSVRLEVALKFLNIKTVEELATFSRERLLRSGSIGQKSLLEIEAILQNHNLRLL